MNKKTMYNISYGLYVLSAREGQKENGCIINTVLQQTSEPNRISITVNKQNYTQGMVFRTGEFNISFIDTRAKFDLFERFGFHSGKDTEKFEGFSAVSRAGNGIYYISENCNAFLSAKVVQSIDLGSHTLFIADVTDGEILSEEASMTYAYYQSNVKPRAEKKKPTGKVWLCRICGYTYDEEKEGVPFEQLPADWVCPICKHGKSDFELMQ